MKHILAAFIFFTRLPFWRIANVPPEYFKRVVDYWPLTGLLTGTTTALVLWLSSHALPGAVAVTFAFIWRVLITGALHEDGFADFFDGFGCGGTRERILAIMKDSHIGTYGVIALIFYFLTVIGLLSSLPVVTACITIVAADTFAKLCGAQLINHLPYARKSEEAKNKIVYDRVSIPALVSGVVITAIPAIFLPHSMLWAYLAPPVVLIVLINIMKRHLGGYTGDCCGATFILCELAFYIVATMTQHAL